MIRFPGSEADMISPYAEATKLSPISKTRKDKVLADYKLTPGGRAGQTDAQLSNIAARAVIDKFVTERNAKKAAEASAAAAARAQAAEVARQTAAAQAAANAAAAATGLSDRRIRLQLERFGIPITAAQVPAWAKTGWGAFNTWLAQYQAQTAAHYRAPAPSPAPISQPMLPNTAMPVPTKITAPVAYKPPVTYATKTATTTTRTATSPTIR